MPLPTALPESHGPIDCQNHHRAGTYQKALGARKQPIHAANSCTFVGGRPAFPGLIRKCRINPLPSGIGVIPVKSRFDERRREGGLFSRSSLTGRAERSSDLPGWKASSPLTRIPPQDLFETNEYLSCLKVLVGVSASQALNRGITVA